MVFMVQRPIWKMAVHVQPRQPIAEIALADRMNFGLGLATSALEGTTEVPCRQGHFRL